MKMFFAYFTYFIYIILIKQLIIITSSSSETITIDIDEGISLLQIGSYSHQLEESILHIFIPFKNDCINSPNSNICEYTKSSNTDITEIGTIIPFERVISAKYNRENISNLINVDIRRIFSYHQMEKFISKTKSIVYFINDNFYITENVNQVTSSNMAVDVNQQTIDHHAINPTTLILKQIFNDRIGYDFLTNEQIAELLTLPLLSRYENLDASDIYESMDLFKKMILGQSIYIIKSCSIAQDNKSLKDFSCLIVSTLFQRIPAESSSIYKVYRLIPLPMVINEQKYVYSTLPKILGINLIDRTIIKWNDEEFSSTCIFSHVIQCREYPMSIPLSSVPCISDILGITRNSYNSCEVSRSQHSQPSIMNIKNNIWLFYSNDESHECVLHSIADVSTKTISVTEPTIIQLPCEETIHCGNIFIPPTRCMNTTVVIKKKNSTNTDRHFSSAIPLKTITKRLVSIYEAAMQNSFIQLEYKIEASHSFFKRIIDRFLSLVVSIVSLILIGILLFILKYLKIKTQKQVNKLRIDLNRLKADFIDEIVCQ